MSSPFDCITELVFVEQQPSKADIILIPGGSHDQLMVRAIELYKQGYAPLILPSGGVNAKVLEWESEWKHFRDLAVESGVPSEAILKEDQAQHTFDNARLSWKVIRDEGLKIERAILICKTQHSRRALLTYQTQFSSSVEFIVCPVVDDRDIRRDNWFLDKAKTEKVMEQVEKIGKYFGKYIPRLD